jgi:DNA-binding transcriptional MocR family regulator
MRPATKGSPRERYEQLRAMNLALDMTRGKPCAEQLDLSNPMLSIVDYIAEDGSDCRNYGALEGLPEARRLFGEYLGVPAANTFVLGNSSLNLMHDLVLQMLVTQVPGETRIWDPHHTLRNRPVMLCPVIGYDRHHTIDERYGIEMLPIPMTPDGPDMDAVEAVLQGPKRWHVFGMWCTPKYSNPSGVTYSRDVCRRLAEMKTWPGFRIFWDLAYNGHDLEEPGDELPDMLELCRNAPHEPDEPSHVNRVFVIGSTSKITFASAGLNIFASSQDNLAWFRRSLFAQTIGPDRLNQLRHVKFLRNADGIRAHMRRHAAIIKPKLDTACEILERELGGCDVAWWYKPRGGYFLPIRFKQGCAKKIVASAKEIGVKLTPAGSTHPYGIDPKDEWGRFAYTYPPTEEVALGAEATAVCALMHA